MKSLATDQSKSKRGARHGQDVHIQRSLPTAANAELPLPDNDHPWPDIHHWLKTLLIA